MNIKKLFYVKNIRIEFMQIKKKFLYLKIYEIFKCVTGSTQRLWISDSKEYEPLKRYESKRTESESIPI